jgi:hypothetical protein
MARWFLILLSGCSLTLSGPDPNRPRQNRPTCDTSKALVALDGALAATMGIVAIGVAGNDGGAAVVPALLGSLFLLSAVHGNSTVDACNREMDSWAATVNPATPEEPVAQLPRMQPEAQLAPAQLAPQPAVQAPPPRAAAQQPPEPQARGEEPWAAFWREVP